MMNLTKEQLLTIARNAEFVLGLEQGRAIQWADAGGDQWSRYDTLDSSAFGNAKVKFRFAPEPKLREWVGINEVPAGLVFREKGSSKLFTPAYIDDAGICFVHLADVRHYAATAHWGWGKLLAEFECSLDNKTFSPCGVMDTTP
jgi:hypothetical protein